MALQFLFAFLLVAITQAVIYHVLALSSLSYSCTILHNRVFEGESNELTEVIENRKLLPLLWMKVETRFSETMLFTKNDNTRVNAGVFHRSVITVPPLRRITRIYKIVCTKRGYYHLGAANITTGDLLGLTSKTLIHKSETGLHVYPVPFSRTEINLPSRSFQGDTVVRRFFLPDPFMPAGVRDYTTGDPQNMINWKASAKSGKLVVQRCDFTSDSKLMVFFNIDYSAESWDNTGAKKANALEHALRILATVLDISISNGQQTALYTNAVSLRDEREVTVPPAMGRKQREELFAAVAEIQFVRTRSFYMLLRSAAEFVKDSDVLLITRYMTKEIDFECDILRRAGNKVEVFIVPDDISER